MRKTGIILVLLFTSLLSFAQVERKVSPAKQPDSVANNAATGKAGMKDIMKDLDLTREQRIKLKEIRQSNKAKKDAIENDDKLPDGEKKTRLRDLQKEQAKSIQAILTDEQKEKFKTKRQEARKNKI